MTAEEICKLINAPPEMRKYIGKGIAPIRVLHELTDINSARGRLIDFV